MKILLINHYAGSPGLGMEFRPFYFGREWVRHGHEVTIIAASFAHVRSRQPIVSSDFTEEILDGVRYVWLKTPEYRGNSLRRIVNMMVFVSKLWLYSATIARKYMPDVVVASSTYPLDNYPAHRIAKKSRALYGYEVHDLWPLSPIELGGYSKNHPFIRIMQAAENYAFKNADIVISMLPKTLDYMKSHGLKPEKWHYVPNGIDPAEWSEKKALPEKHLSIINKIKLQGNFIVSYAGSIGIGNALDNLIGAAALLGKDPVQILVIGDGPEKKRLAERSASSHITNVNFLDPVPRNQIPAFLEQCDILYIGLQNQSLFRFGISPNKLLDYMMAGKPIIQAINAGNDIVSDAGCGISIEPENPAILAEAIKKIVTLPVEEKKKMGEKGMSYVKRYHDYKLLAQKMLSLFLSVKNYRINDTTYHDTE
jgi:glycosyltransferase involved in cell wall biosynthesis